MKLDLRFTTRPLENLWCNTVVALVFQGPFKKWDGAWGLDAKISGRLTTLLQKGFWTGLKGETLLIPSQNMIKADKILLKGMGPIHEFDVDDMDQRIMELGNTLVHMGIHDIAVQIPNAAESRIPYRFLVESACIRLIDSLLAEYQDVDNFLLKLIVSLGDIVDKDLGYIVQCLKEHFMSKLDATIIID